MSEQPEPLTAEDLAEVNQWDDENVDGYCDAARWRATVRAQQATIDSLEAQIKAHDLYVEKYPDMEAEVARLTEERDHWQTAAEEWSRELDKWEDRKVTAESQLTLARTALEQHAKPLAEWDMLFVNPDGTMTELVGDARWARAHIDALLDALAKLEEKPQALSVMPEEEAIRRRLYWPPE